MKDQVQLNIVVTGGHGFIGQHMLPALVSRGHRVAVFDLMPKPVSLNKVSYIHFSGDVLSQDWLESNWPAEVDVVIHLIGLANFRAAHDNPHKSFLLNVSSLEIVLEVSQQSSTDRFILPSAAAVYGITGAKPTVETAPIRPLNIYSHHKLLAELLLQAHAKRYGMGYVVLRLFNVYGRGQRGIIGEAIRRARTGEPLTLFGADQLRDFVHVGDVVEAFVRAAESERAENMVFNIGTGRGVSIREVVSLVQEQSPELQVIFTNETTDPPFDSVADIRLAKEILRWEPHASIDFLRQCIAKEMNHD
ncbi:NAD-dependent epimerase/dehydratase family protein [Acidobacteria bacterium AH-259-L09]|nr:NAD-dependent epimerase/dehydratase family protein [Acidobacteria bacterium AH-259-L09]